MKPRISIVINTLNGERYLPYTLRSVRSWADEIIVVDMHSEDRTVEIACEYGAKVYFHDRILAFDGARAFAVSQATGDWIFILDQDEMIPQPLSVKLMQIASEDTADVVIISRLNYLLGGPLLHAGWGPHQDFHPRFFKKDKVNLIPQIHACLQLAQGARVLTLPYQGKMVYHHFNYMDCAQFIEKMNCYTTVEAQQAFERGEHASMAMAARRAAVEFINRYVRARGYRDGWRGFYLCGFMAMYRWAICAKLQELYVTGGRNKILETYNIAAANIVAEYEGNQAKADIGAQVQDHLK
jgi:glycosyltransferase involved in cell wall biosynthesis